MPVEELIDAIEGYDVDAKTHSTVASVVLTGTADDGPGIRIVADQNGLDFVPLRDEEYDFVARRQQADKPAIKAFPGILRPEQFRSRLKTLGYRAQ